MEPKNPIVINGVDVSECKYITYRSRLHPMCGNTCTRCYYRKNCYFKQLARKTQECENWKETANQYAKNEEYYRCQVGQLKVENEKYKKKFQKFFNIDNQECWDVAFFQDEKAQAEKKLKMIKEIVLNKCIDSNLKCEEIIKVLQTIYEVE